ncbi:MAG TPA: ABC-three component system protein [Pirellulales bacterium]
MSRLLRNAAELRSQLIQNWDTYCLNAITETGPTPLDAALRAHLDELDFSIFDAIPPLRIIDGHAKTRWHVARFGGGLPARPPIVTLPDTPTAEEITYIRHLLDAYGSHLDRVIARLDELSDEELKAHLLDSRREFYSAESLRAFSRDTLPPGEFERLQDELHSGIGDEIRAAHDNGYRRVLAVVKIARSLQLTAHALVSRLTIRDRGGICHQLANDDKLRWIK